MKFSFLGLGGHESPPLQLYGKLPVAKDYLRIGCGDGPSRDLRDWLDRTFGTVREHEEPLILGEPLRFLIGGERDPVLGCLWPSADAGGHRKFPFMLLIDRRRKPLLADLEQGNLAQAEVAWRLLAERHEKCAHATDGQELLAEHRGTDINLGEVDHLPGAPADFDAWLECLWGEEGLEQLFGLFARVIQLAGGGHRGPYRLPLVRALPIRDQVVAWVAVLRSIGAVSKDEVPTLFFPPRALLPSDELAALVVSARALRDDEVRWLTARDDDTDLGPADFSGGNGCSEDTLESPPEGERWLREKLLELLASYTARDV